MDIHTGSQASRAEKTTRIQDEFLTQTQVCTYTEEKHCTRAAEPEAILLVTNDYLTRQKKDAT